MWYNQRSKRVEDTAMEQIELLRYTHVREAGDACAGSEIASLPKLTISR